MKTLGYNSLMMMMVITINLVVVLSSPSSQYEDSKLVMNSKVDVHVMNEMSSLPILVRCQSKDDDLGYHILDTAEEFQLNFKNNIFDTTLFFCHFYMEDAASKRKDTVFDVFTENYMNNPDCCSHYPERYHYRCYWLVRDDGFYLGPDLNNRRTFVRLHEW
ncbi:hypothetical protein DM860_016895 [Cuscuta australis]|uniref:S-protein homolog n=1 Tax=Cuscuta australis TaxID=267555 RepID=A0A328E0X1_9ASTE|nr:hypothetical protein DM860_016895 [Cuscuta australis]